MEIAIDTAQSREEFLLEHHGVRIFIKRDDLIHPDISGNKWRKLKYHLQDFYSGSYQQILSFGGAFSNHLAALAALGKITGIPTYAMVRGDEAGDSPTLDFCTRMGMEWEGISRKDYQLKDNPEFLQGLKDLRPGLYIIPEGGKGAAALRGCAEIVDELVNQYDGIALAAGTGTTAAGLLANSLSPQIFLYSALKGGSFHKSAIAKYLDEYQAHYGLGSLPADWLNRKLILRTDYHFGGFAKINSDLVRFMNRFYEQHGLKLDPVYTSKLLFGLLKDIEEGLFKAGSRILVLHSGGLQGVAGMNKRLAKNGQELIAYE